MVYAGRLGVGPFSTLARSSLDNEGIVAPIEQSDDQDAGICLVLLEPDGERSFVTGPGAESTLRSSDLDKLDVRSGDYVLVSGYNVMYPGVAEMVIAWLRGLPRGVNITFDPATRMVDIPASNVEAMFELSTWLFCNADEASALTGSTNALDATSRLASGPTALNVVVRSGADGCVVAGRNGQAQLVGGFATTVLDTNGAGDVHNGVFIAELATGHDPLAAARWANAAAAMAISVLGPASCPSRDNVAAWIAQHES